MNWKILFFFLVDYKGKTAMEWETDLTDTRKLMEFLCTSVIISKTCADEEGSHFDGMPRWSRICLRFLDRLYPFYDRRLKEGHLLCPIMPHCSLIHIVYI
jgi:hypothetical protein